MIKAFSLVFTRIATRLKCFSNVRTIVNYIKCMARLDYKNERSIVCAKRVYARPNTHFCALHSGHFTYKKCEDLKQNLSNYKTSRSSNIHNRMSMATTKTMQKTRNADRCVRFRFCIDMYE